LSSPSPATGTGSLFFAQNHAPIRRIRVQHFHERGAGGEHGSLIEVTFIGDLVVVNRGRRIENDGAADAVGASPAWRLWAASPATNDFIGYKIKRLQHAIMTELETILRPYNLRPMDFAILNIVGANPGIHQGGVAGLLGAEPPAVVLASDRLESADLLARYSDPTDRRLRALYLTQNGSKLLPLVLKDVNAQERKFQSAIPTSHLANFDSALDRLLRTYSILK
jgi:DNA-binding MarR family transcriptional regulator